MKSLPTLERNFLSPDVQRETICTPEKASISYRQYDAEVDDKLSETMNERIGIKRIRLQKLFAKHNVLQRNCLEKVQIQLARKVLM